MLLFVLFFVFLSTGMCEAHVFCKLAHVTGWTALGYSCPINCASVVEAVKRLQEMDFAEFFEMQKTQLSANFKFHANLSSKYDYSDELNNDLYTDSAEEKEPKRRDNEIKELKNPTPAHLRELYTVLLNKKSGNELQALCKIASARLKNNTCQSSNKIRKNKYKRFLSKTCIESSMIEDDFLMKFTAILNKYSSSSIFSEDLTVVILEKLLGKSLDFRSGLFDVQKILTHIRQAISEQKRQGRAAETVINLKSKFCLNTYVPGCFCISGFVESNGRCLLPRDCFPKSDDTDRAYVARVNIQ